MSDEAVQIIGMELRHNTAHSIALQVVNFAGTNPPSLSATGKERPPTLRICSPMALERRAVSDSEQASSVALFPWLPTEFDFRMNENCRLCQRLSFICSFIQPAKVIRAVSSNEEEEHEGFLELRSVFLMCFEANLLLP